MPTGLTTQDIQCIKDGLIVETSDLLGVSVRSCDPYVFMFDILHACNPQFILHCPFSSQDCSL